MNEFIYITDHTYTRLQVFRMEQLLLKVLAFDLSIPTVYTFLNSYATIMKMTDQCKFLAMVSLLMRVLIPTKTAIHHNKHFVTVPMRIVTSRSRSISTILAINNIVCSDRIGSSQFKFANLVQKTRRSYR